MASVPRTAARRPALPPVTASPAAIASQSPELLAAFESQAQRLVEGRGRGGGYRGVDRLVHGTQLTEPFGYLQADWSA